MGTWRFRSVLGLFLASCGGQAGVILDIGAWPEGATQLRVEGVLDGLPALTPLTFPAQTTRFGVFGAMTSLPTAQSTTGVVAADFDRDGRIDLASSNGQSSVSVLLGNGTGGFSTITDLPGVGVPGRVTVADIDGDGDEGLLVPSAD